MKFNKLYISFSLVLIALLSATGISQPKASTFIYDDAQNTSHHFKQHDSSKAFVFEESANYNLQSDQEDQTTFTSVYGTYFKLDSADFHIIPSQDSWIYLQDRKSKLATQIFPFHFFT
ncbi:hypothetical protein [Zunongwangia sp. HGR-M22]|uniref:hypothetical protein n=1 Tax=Zunongwangia sp. HGR-M22 TaxID=3015168 RepID=UPI0022DDE78E|nr:hypothetical protein [Zunongwangia sp. HGR-M22]WBL25604.1 hypothetical protein PBT91_17130 [Zunongwangia sp. HGR-M22]